MLLIWTCFAGTVVGYIFFCILINKLDVTVASFERSVALETQIVSLSDYYYLQSLEFQITAFKNKYKRYLVPSQNQRLDVLSDKIKNLQISYKF